jgi:hypothetical protein
VTVTKLDHGSHIIELHPAAKDWAVAYSGGNQGPCKRVRPEQPWHEIFQELVERHRSSLSQPQPGNEAWECERKTWRVCEAVISTAPAIDRIWECEKTYGANVRPERTATMR